MSVLCSQYWPVAAVALAIGLIAGWIGFAPGRRPAATLTLGAAAAIAAALAWHGPGGAGERLAGRIEAEAAAELQRLEMPRVTARVERGPIHRRLLLSGPGNDFQQSELARILSSLPGVAAVRWTNRPTAEAAR